MKKQLHHLLKKNLSLGQLMGYSIANLLGVTVICIGVMFFADSKHAKESADQYFSDDYIVLSKKVQGLLSKPKCFTETDIKHLKEQAWVKRVGRFTSAQFPVDAAVNVGEQGISTFLFLEAVPDSFFDVKPNFWKFDEKTNFVPIVINKDYLALYNYGFAIPQGLPQLSEQMLQAVPIELTIWSVTGQPHTFKASVVGFSSRLNTIAVPESFLKWANQKYGKGQEAEPARLIVQINRLKAADMKQFIAQQGWEMGGDKSNDGNISKFLATASLVIALVGIIISALACFILILSIFLLLLKSKEKLVTLMMLGYSTKQVVAFYRTIIVSINCCAVAIAVLLTLLARTVWTPHLNEVGLGNAHTYPLFLIAAAYLLLIIAISMQVVKKRIHTIWNPN